MPGHDRDVLVRDGLVRKGLLLEVLSVAWGTGAGAWAILAALGADSLGVLALGLNVLADVVGSLGVAWRLWIELRGTSGHEAAERRASVVVQASLAVLAVFLAVEAARRFAAGGTSHASSSGLAATAASIVVLSVLGVAKRRTGRALESHSLSGDGALSAIGAVIAVIALASLLLDKIGWWWADPGAALAVAALAAAELVRIQVQRARSTGGLP